MRLLYKLIRDKYFDYRIKKSNGKVIYYIAVGSNVEGFFAILRTALDYCCYADEHGFVPYIVYSKDILYFEKALFLGTNNPFEYYYEQLKELSLVEMLRRNTFIKCSPKHLNEIELKYNLKSFSYLVEESYIEKMADIYKKYIHLNAMTERMIGQSIMKRLQGKRTLGVHIRGTDFFKEFNNHPVPVSVDEYIRIIDKEIKRERYEQVFVATDDIRCLKEVKQKITVPLVYYNNTMRSKGNKSVAFERSNRKNNNYLLGLEVLKDAYTLAASDGFIGCLSQVDIFVQIIKRSQGQRFRSLKIIDKGIVSNNRQCWEPSR